MCGICGIFNFNKQPLNPESVRAMCSVIKHRGPDDEGIFTASNISLGMRRLSIIDLKTGHQPICNEDKSIWIVLNGEIYNFQEQREILQNKGHKFTTNSDTEVIVHLYEEYKEKCVDYLRGMFAFALWDTKAERLFIARDRIGKKPLFYAVINGSFIFASEMKSILKHLEATPEINLSAIHNYLTYQYIPGPGTIFKTIARLQPAHTLTCDKTGRTNIQKYWNIDFTKKTSLSFEDAKMQLREILTEATKLRMISDVPLGAFLSGGLDSSIIVALMSKLSIKPVKTFSIGFKEETFSELPYAKIVADHYKTEHHEFTVEPHFVDILEKIVWHYDQPFADTSSLPSYYVANVTRQHVTVALNGDGGDENFAGYLRHKAMKGSAYFGFPFRLMGKNLTKHLANLIPHTESANAKSKFRYMNRMFSALAETPGRRNAIWHCYFDNETKNRIYSKEMKALFADDDAYDYLENTFVNSPANDTIDRTLYTDLMTYLPECLLVKMDIASMANSLETRSPLLDHKLIEFTATLPSNWKLHNFTSKYIFKETFKDLLPEQIQKRGKQGFGIPVGKWFKHDLKDYARQVLLDSKSLNRGYFDKKEVSNLLEDHISGKSDHGYRIWALLMLELWHKVYIDNKGV
ncbi:MAG: asparagine synthase (glutamine-hydrolyzing) [Elusimicrobia bacterium RIFOXYA2_FULL_39_19]|nr:MAG: asparagine synthase (glutamine-hydrolyzing) [Elusimicrobia bacterium RIFOXYA2_FULL_39_19]